MVQRGHFEDITVHCIYYSNTNYNVSLSGSYHEKLDRSAAHQDARFLKKDIPSLRLAFVHRIKRTLINKLSFHLFSYQAKALTLNHMISAAINTPAL